MGQKSKIKVLVGLPLKSPGADLSLPLPASGNVTTSIKIEKLEFRFLEGVLDTPTDETLRAGLP